MTERNLKEVSDKKAELRKEVEAFKLSEDMEDAVLMEATV